MRTFRPVLGVVVLAAAVAFSLSGGAGSGSGASTEPCPPPSGRQFCITITDTQPVSASVDGVVAYVLYTISVQNVGGTTLTNGVLSTTLEDLVEAPLQKSSANFIASASSPGCAAVSGPTNTVACTVGNLAAGQSSPSFQLVYRTSTTPGVVSTDAEVVGAFKEKGNDNQKNDPNPDTRPVVETTTYEPCPECSDAWVPPGQRVRLATTQTGATYSSLAFTYPTGLAAFLATLDEFDTANSSDFCTPDRECFGQVMRTDVSAGQTGTFLLEREATWTEWPGSVNDKKLVIVHTLDSGLVETISRHCTTTPPTLADVTKNGPCLVPSLDRKAGLLSARWWIKDNGFDRGG